MGPPNHFAYGGLVHPQETCQHVQLSQHSVFFSRYSTINYFAQLTISPKLECFGHFGGIHLLFTTNFGGIRQVGGNDGSSKHQITN